MIWALRRVDHFLSKIAEILTAVTICVQMVIMFAGVIFRYFLNSPLNWCDELSAYLLVLVTFFGGYVALRTGLLAKIELVVDRFPLMGKRTLLFVGYASTLIFLGAIVYFGILLTASPVVMMQVTPAMEMPIFWFYAIIPLGALMMLVHMIIKTYDMLRGKDEQVEKTEKVMVAE